MVSTVSSVHSLATALENNAIPKGVLFPCSDSAVLLLSELIQNNSDYLASVAMPDCIRTISNKALLARVMQKNNLPHPCTIFINSQTDLAKLEIADLSHTFLKPVNSEGFLREFGVKGLRVANRDDLELKVNRFLNCKYELLLQEYIPGPPSNHYFVDGFVDRHCQISALFARRRIRIFPEDFGNSSYMYSIPLCDVESAISTLEVILTKLNYRGIFSAEFKLDIRDNQYNLIEINTRPWWFVEFAARCGVNVCKMAYDDALGREVEPVVQYQVGRKFVYPYYDFEACRELYRQKQLTLSQWLKSWWRAETPIFSWDDPLPALYSSWSWFKGFLSRRLSKNATLPDVSS